MNRTARRTAERAIREQIIQAPAHNTTVHEQTNFLQDSLQMAVELGTVPLQAGAHRLKIWCPRYQQQQ